MLRVEIWMGATFFAVGVIVAMTWMNSKDSSFEAAPATKEIADSVAIAEFAKPYESQFPSEVNGSGRTPVQLGDRYLLAGNYALALDQYYDSEKSSADAGTAILVREAFCFEKQKHYELASKKYYRTYTTAANENHRLLGIAGLARCLFYSGQRSDALEILAEQTLKLDQYENAPEEIRAQLEYYFAIVLQSFAIEQIQDLTAPTGVAFEDSSPRPDIFLSVVDQPAPALTANSPDSSNFSIEILQRPSPSLNVITTSISAKLEPVLVSIAQIAAAAELELFASKTAQEILKNRSRTIELHASPLSSVLDRLLVSFDLAWYQNDSSLYIVAQHELDTNHGLDFSASPNYFWFETSLRAFRRFELSHAEDVRRHASLLSRANLNLLQKKYDVAANLLQQLTQVQPGDEVLAKLFFNQAKLQMLLDRKVEANRYLYLAVDQTLDPDIESSSYCLLGSNQLSAGDLENAIKSSRRGLATAVNAKQKQVASLNLARAYLLDNDPFSANKALFLNRSSYHGSATPVASVLGAYAHFIGVSDERGIKTARNRLLSAVVMMPADDYESFVDCYVASQAYAQLGFQNKAIDKLVLALAKPDVGQWKRQLLLELAILQRQTGNNEAALVTLQSLVEVEDRWTKFALNELAEIFADTNQTELCIETCQKLWKAELTEDQKRSALQVLGRAYQKRGEHHAAALCFAGMLPATF